MEQVFYSEPAYYKWKHPNGASIRNINCYGRQEVLGASKNRSQATCQAPLGECDSLKELWVWILW